MRKRHWKRGARSGFTFTEVLVAVTLLVIGFMGIYASMHSSALVRETAHETNVAMFKLQTTVEYMFGIPFDDLTTALPEGQAIDIEALAEGAGSNGFVLSNETVTVDYEDPTADPLKFTVTMTWNSRLGNARTATISSARGR